MRESGTGGWGLGAREPDSHAKIQNDGNMHKIKRFEVM